MSSSRTTKRKRSKAGDPATSSTRERAEAADAAHTERDTGKITSEEEEDVKRAADVASSKAIGSATDAKNNSEEKKSGSESVKQSTDQGGTKKEAAEPIRNGKSVDTDKNSTTAAKSPTDKDTNSSTMMSIDASSTSTSSQDGTSTRRQALHIANDDDDREKRILDLISHRTILLDRIMACRESAEHRIGKINENNNNNMAADEQEIAAFRSMTKQANQAARKSREAETAGEKRTSLSLRRGSSVGKRMNAALSSLAPGSSAAAAAAANTTTTTGGTAVAASAGLSTAVTSTKSSNPSSIEKAEAKGPSPVKYNATTTTKTSGRLPINNLAQDAAASATIAIPSSIKSTISSKAIKSHSPFTKQYEVTGRGRPPNSSKAAKKTGGLAHSLGQQPTMKKGLAMGIRSMPPNLSKQGPRVNFPEAMALREKRDQIEAKLASLLEQKQRKASLGGKMLHSEEDQRRKSGPGGGMAKPLLNQKRMHPFYHKTGVEIAPPAPLPNRRRTHWDVVLQEMSWLASDFIEERKWKLSTCRLLSSNIPPQGMVRKRTCEANRASSNNNSSSSEAMETSSSSNSEEISSREGTESEKADARRKYSVPVTEDEELAKCRSQILSSMIFQLDSAIKKGGSLEASDKHHQEALASFVASRSEILEKTTDAVAKDFESDSKNDDDDDDMSDEDTNKENSGGHEPEFDTIDEYVDHFHTLSKSKHKLAAKETAKALKTGKIKLTPKQKEMLEFVDKLWSGEPHVGAVLSGSDVSGLTFGTATILWKQRTQGSQLLISPSSSLVSTILIHDMMV